jgi:hypothetical protein
MRARCQTRDQRAENACARDLYLHVYGQLASWSIVAAASLGPVDQPH